MSRGTPWLFNFLATVAAINIAWLILSANELPQNLEIRRFHIVIALVISAAAAWPRRAVGWAISFVALLWIAFEYLMWWRGSRIVIEASGSDFSRTPHLLYLLNARWWDLGVLLLTVVGLLWCGVYLVKQLAQARKLPCP